MKRSGPQPARSICSPPTARCQAASAFGSCRVPWWKMLLYWTQRAILAHLAEEPHPAGQGGQAPLGLIPPGVCRRRKGYRWLAAVRRPRQAGRRTRQIDSIV